MFPIPINEANWHVAIAHFPFALFEVSALIMILATLWKDGRWQRVAIGFAVLASLLAVITAQFGDGAEHIVRRAIADAGSYIQPHEELADTARNIIVAFGIVMIALWWFTRKHTLLPIWASWGSVVIMIGISLLLMNVMELGGKINHPELRATTAPASGQIQEDDDDNDH